jgi:hypothetical protein
MKDHKWARLLAYATGLLNQTLLLQNEYLIVENRLLRRTSARPFAADRFAKVYLVGDW